MNYRTKQSISCILLVVILITSPMYGHKKAYATGSEMSNIHATYEEVVGLVEMIALSAAGYSIEHVAEKTSEGKWKLKETGKELLERAGYVNEQREKIIANIKEMYEKNTGDVVEGLGDTLSAILSSKTVQGIADTLHQLFISEYSSSKDMSFYGAQDLVCSYSETGVTGYSGTGVVDTVKHYQYQFGRCAVYATTANGVPVIAFAGRYREYISLSREGHENTYMIGSSINSVRSSLIPSLNELDVSDIAYSVPYFPKAEEAVKWLNGIGMLTDYDFSLPKGTVLDPETTRPAFYSDAYPDALTIPKGATDPNAIIDAIAENGIDSVVGEPIQRPEPKEELAPNPDPGPQPEESDPNENTDIENPDSPNLFERLWEWLQRILDAIIALPANLWNLLQKKLQDISDFLSAIYEWLQNLSLQSLLELLASIPGAIWNLFTNTLQGILDTLELIYELIKNMLSSIFKVTVINFEELIDLLSAFLPGMLEDIFHLPMLALQELLQEVFVGLFVPDLEVIRPNIDKLAKDFNLKFPIIGQIFLIIGAFVEGSEGNMPDFVMYPYGVRVRLVEFDWFLDYLDVIHGIVIAICWYQFLSRTYKKLPAIIGGFNGL